MKEEEKREQSVHKLLFLGPGGGGKSTIFKQLQWLHGDGFTEFDLRTLTDSIHVQTITQMQSAITHYLSDPTPDTELQTAIDSVRNTMFTSVQRNSPKPWSELAASIAYIWKNDERLRAVFGEYDAQHILWASTEYFWDALPRISAANYIPNKLDIVKVRTMSTGVVQKRFTIDQCKFHIFDVGGQRSERKKWITCFDNVSAVVFVAALSCYNELMFEDKTTNCMVDALELFDKTINNEQFIQKPIILFLNKRDIFERKVKKIGIDVCPAFEDFDDKCVYNQQYEDTDQYHQGAAYIKMKFDEMNKGRRSVYTHFTCAMEDKNVDYVFTDIVSVVLGKIYQSVGSHNLL
eukprot:211753_1